VYTLIFKSLPNHRTARSMQPRWSRSRCICAQWTHVIARTARAITDSSNADWASCAAGTRGAPGGAGNFPLRNYATRIETGWHCACRL